MALARSSRSVNKWPYVTCQSFLGDARLLSWPPWTRTTDARVEEPLLNMTINNLVLPSALAEAIKGNRWPKQVANSETKRLFWDDALTLFSPETMESETAALIACCAHTSLNYDFFLGTVEPRVPGEEPHRPGVIDMTKAVVIGDDGIDAPICLDYRDNPLSVIALRAGWWEKVYPNVTRSWKCSLANNAGPITWTRTRTKRRRRNRTAR
jgi:hypothetical protein